MNMDMNMKKYTMLMSGVTLNGHKLYIIQALRSFGNVKAGDLGGFIESEDNLSHHGNCWVYDNARVMDMSWVSCNARVSENAMVYGEGYVSGNAQVHGNARVFGVGQVHGNAQVYGDAQIWANAQVFGNAEVYENASVYGIAHVYGNTHVCGNAHVCKYSQLCAETPPPALEEPKSINIEIGKTYIMQVCDKPELIEGRVTCISENRRAVLIEYRDEVDVWYKMEAITVVDYIR